MPDITITLTDAELQRLQGVRDIKGRVASEAAADIVEAVEQKVDGLDAVGELNFGRDVACALGVGQTIENAEKLIVEKVLEALP